jgi:hypothetical protein
LQRVTGFDDRIKSIKADEKTGIESGIAELIAGKFFRIAGAQFQYVVAPADSRGTNPDIEYVAGHNRVELCEVKCNLGTTQLNERSITNILETARKQLPKGKAGLILLRVPEEWIADMELGTSTIENAIIKFFRHAKTTRVSSVFTFISETRVFFTQEKMAQMFRVKAFRNTHCEKGPGICIPFHIPDPLPNWTSLQSLVAAELGLALPSVASLSGT